jgi:hypothetical protein
MRLYYGAAEQRQFGSLRTWTGPSRMRLRFYKGGVLLAIGREPQSAAASRLLEEGLATADSKVELVLVDEDASLSFTVGDVVG